MLSKSPSLRHLYSTWFHCSLCGWCVWCKKENITVMNFILIVLYMSKLCTPFNG